MAEQKTTGQQWEISTEEQGKRRQLIQKILNGRKEPQDDGVKAIRRYIINKCKDPETPYFPSDKGDKYLSIVDLYREAIDGTRLGKEQAEVWRQMSSENIAR